MDLSKSSHNHLVRRKLQQARVVKSECCGLFQMTAMECAADCVPSLIEFCSPANFSQIIGKRQRLLFSFMSPVALETKRDLVVVCPHRLLSSWSLYCVCGSGSRATQRR